MSWVGVGVAAGSLALNVGGRVAAGMATSGVDSTGAVSGAEGIATEERALTQRDYQSSLTGLKSSFALGQKGLGLQAGKSLMSLNQNVSSAYRKAGFATSGQITQQKGFGKKSVWDTFKLKQEGLQSSLDIGKERASIAQQKSLGAIEQRLQGRLDQISMTPDTFGEGFWGTSDGQIG
jgi:hypothetical protein